jgi:hypothetical protein
MFPPMLDPRHTCMIVLYPAISELATSTPSQPRTFKAAWYDMKVTAHSLCCALAVEPINAEPIKAGSVMASRRGSLRVIIHGLLAVGLLGALTHQAMAVATTTSIMRESRVFW